MWDLNALKSTFVVSSMLAVGGGLIAMNKKVKNAGYVLLGGAIGTLLSIWKIMSPSEVAVLLSSIPVGILGGISASRRMLEHADKRIKKKMIKKGNPFSVGRKP